MSCNKSLPNQRLISDENKANIYLEGSIEDYAKKVTALQSMLHHTIESLNDVTNKNEGMTVKVTLSDIINCCEYNANNLQVYFEFMCDLKNEMREDTNSIVLKFEKTISALLLIILNSKNLLEEEAIQSKKHLENGITKDDLIIDCLNTCRYCTDDLEAFCSLMDSVLLDIKKSITNE